MSNTIKIKQIDQTQLAAFVNDILDGTGAVYTANRALVTDGAGDVTTSSVTATELGYLSGVTSAIQTQFNNLGSTYLALAGGTMTGPITLHASSLLKWGATASFPALKRNSAELQVRLADDSEFTGLRCSYLNVQPASGLSWLYFGSQYIVTIGSKFLFSNGINLTGGDLEMWDKGIYFGSNGTQINDIYLIRDAAGVLSQRYGTTSQTLRVYGTYTDASNYVRASLAATSTTVTLAAETAGTGADNIDLNLRATGTGAVTVGNGSNQFSLYIHDGNSNCIAIREGGGGSYIGTVVDRNLVLMRDSVRAATLTANGFMLGNAADAGISRNADGVVEVNNGTPGTYRDLKLRTLYGEGGTLTGNLTISGASLFVGGSYAIAIGDAGNGYYGGWMANTYLALSPNTVFGWNSGDGTTVKDVLLRRDAANTLALRNGSNGQKLRVYGDYTGASQYCALEISCTQTGGDYFSHYIGPVNAGESDYWNDNRGEIGGWAFLTISAMANASGDAGALFFRAGGYYFANALEGGQNAYFDGRGSASPGSYGHKNYFSNANTASHTLGLWQVSGHTKSALTVYTNSVLKADITSTGAFRSYGAWTDDSNYVRASLSAAASSVTLAAETAGTGADDVSISINPAGTGVVGIGGLTSSYPALKRSSTELQVRLADDSGYANIRAANLITQGEIQTDNVNLYIRNAGSATLIIGADVLVYQRFLSFGSGGANYADCSIGREAAGVLALRNDHYYAGFVSHTLRIYGARTDDSNYVRASLAATSTSVTLSAETAGTGADNVDLILSPAGAGSVSLNGNLGLYYDGAKSTINKGSTLLLADDGNHWFSFVRYTGFIIDASYGAGINFSTGGVGPSGSVTLSLVHDGSDVFAQRRSTNAQTMRVYGTYTDASNYVRASLAATSTTVTLAAETAGTGADDISISLNPAGTGVVGIGGLTSSYPALKRSSTELQVRLADDSGYAGINAASYTFSGGASLNYNGSEISSTHRLLSSTGLVSEGYLAIGPWPNYTYLYAAGADIFEQRRTTNAQTLRVYGTYTDASNYVRASLAATSTSVTLAAETAGTGADEISINLTPAGAYAARLVLEGSATSNPGWSIGETAASPYIQGTSGGSNSITFKAYSFAWEQVNVGTAMVIESGTGCVGIGTASPTHLLSLGGNSARTIWMERHTTSDTAGNNLTVQAGSATSGATNKAGGYLDLLGGISTGTAESGVRIKGYVAGSSGTSDTSASTMIEVLGNKVGFFGVTPVVRQTTGIAAATFVANTSAIADDTATWDGYTAGQIVTALKNVGILT